MFDGVQRRAGVLSAIGLLVVLPTTVLVAVAVLKYVVGVAPPFDTLEPALTPIVTQPLGETFIVLAPYVALMLVAVPVTRVAIGWRAGRLTATITRQYTGTQCGRGDHEYGPCCLYGALLGGRESIGGGSLIACRALVRFGRSVRISAGMRRSSQAAG